MPFRKNAGVETVVTALLLIVVTIVAFGLIYGAYSSWINSQRHGSILELQERLTVENIRFSSATDASLYVFNVGEADINITSVDINGGVSTVASSVNIPPGGSAWIDVVYPLGFSANSSYSFRLITARGTSIEVYAPFTGVLTTVTLTYTVTTSSTSATSTITTTVTTSTVTTTSTSGTSTQTITTTPVVTTTVTEGTSTVTSTATSGTTTLTSTTTSGTSTLTTTTTITLPVTTTTQTTSTSTVTTATPTTTTRQVTTTTLSSSTSQVTTTTQTTSTQQVTTTSASQSTVTTTSPTTTTRTVTTTSPTTTTSTFATTSQTTTTSTIPRSQVTYVSAGVGSGTTGNPTPSYPSGLQAGDLILLQVTVRDTTNTPTTPAGFSLLFGPDSTGTGRQWIYSMISDGTESGTITISIGGNVNKMARMYAFRNVAAASFTEGGGFLSGTSATISAPSVTTTDTYRLAVAFVFVNDDNAVGSFTGETGGDWTEAVAEFTSTAGSDGCVQLQTAAMPTAGTISGGSYTMGAADPWGVRGFALKPKDPVTTTITSQVTTTTSTTRTSTVTTSSPTTSTSTVTTMTVTTTTVTTTSPTTSTLQVTTTSPTTTTVTITTTSPTTETLTVTTTSPTTETLVITTTTTTTAVSQSTSTLTSGTSTITSWSTSGTSTATSTTTTVTTVTSSYTTTVTSTTTSGTTTQTSSVVTTVTSTTTSGTTTYVTTVTSTTTHY